MYSISCSACGEGSTSYEKPTWGYGVVISGIVLALVYVIYSYRQNRESKFRDKLRDLSNRVLGIDEEEKIREQHQKRLERLEPLLEAMEKKLGEDDILVTNKEGVRIFDAELLYTELDVDKSGDLSYEELNNVLDLRPRQLEEFMNYMNQLGGAIQGEETVSKEIFVHHFLETLDQASNFDPSGEEAERLYDQLIRDLNVPESIGIDINRFHETHLSSFLNETQIIKLKNKFQATQDTKDDAENFETNDRVVPKYKSIRLTKSVTIKAAHLDKATFVQYYSTFLSEIKDEGIPEEISSNEMIDLTFQNLSLHVSVKDQKKAVVNNVTGRVHQKSMTALLVSFLI